MKKSATAVAVSAAIGASGAASAESWGLVAIDTYSTNGAAPLSLAGDLTFESDAANNLTSNGAFSGQAFVGPNPIFRHEWGAGTNISGAGTITGSFQCIEGVFGGFVGASICGNYTFGANYVNESTVNTDGSNKVIGGDDVDIGPAQSVADFTGFVPNGGDFVTTIVLRNSTTFDPMTMEPTDGQQWSFAILPEAVDDNYPLPQGSGAVPLDIGANDTNWSPNATVTGPATGSLGGTFVVNPDADVTNVTVTYTPPGGGTTGTDTWTYSVTNTEAPFDTFSDMATVSVVISPLGATDDNAATTSLRTPVVIPVGANDFGFTDPSSVTVTTPPMQGTVMVSGSPGMLNDVTITYQSTAPLGSAPSVDTFVYTVTDSVPLNDSATVTVQVNNIVPVANDLSGVTLDTQGVDPSDASVDIIVGTGGDIPGNMSGDAPSVVTTTPSNDVMSVVNGEIITITATAFTSAGDAVGYTITDVDTEEATGTINVTIPNVTPQVANVTQTIAVPGPTKLSAAYQLGNGTANDHTATASAAQWGTVSGVEIDSTTGTIDFDYTPTGFAEIDTFTIDMTDGDGSVGSGTVTVTISGNAVTIEKQDSLPGNGNAVGPVSLGAMLLGIPLLRARRRNRKA